MNIIFREHMSGKTLDLSKHIQNFTGYKEGSIIREGKKGDCPWWYIASITLNRVGDIFETTITVIALP